MVQYVDHLWGVGKTHPLPQFLPVTFAGLREDKKGLPMPGKAFNREVSF